MDFSAFLDLFSRPAAFESYRVMCLKSNSYYPLFMRLLSEKISASLHVSCTVIEPGEIKLSELIAHLSISFLGQRSLCWIKNSAGFDTQTRKKVFEWLDLGSNEHPVLISSELTGSCKERDGALVVVVPDGLDEQTGLLLASSMISSEQSVLSFIKKLYQVHKRIPLDHLVMLCSYARVLGQKQQAHFCEMWLEKIVEPDKSLFTLSQYFFSRQPHEFLTLWSKVRSDYPDEFWVVFWSEQLWQALTFIEKARIIGATDARKYVSRLPFSFMQKDWQLHDAERLIRGMTYLYTTDHALKNGAGSLGIDYFVRRFVAA